MSRSSYGETDPLSQRRKSLVYLIKNVSRSSAWERTRFPDTVNGIRFCRRGIFIKQKKEFDTVNAPGVFSRNVF